LNQFIVGPIHCKDKYIEFDSAANGAFKLWFKTLPADLGLYIRYIYRLVHTNDILYLNLPYHKFLYFQVKEMIF
jgi:hypothetical protein